MEEKVLKVFLFGAKDCIIHTVTVLMFATHVLVKIVMWKKCIIRRCSCIGLEVVQLLHYEGSYSAKTLCFGSDTEINVIKYRSEYIMHKSEFHTQLFVIYQYACICQIIKKWDGMWCTLLCNCAFLDRCQMHALLKITTKMCVWIGVPLENPYHSIFQWLGSFKSSVYVFTVVGWLL